MFESKLGIIFIAGIGFFVLAFVSNVTVPAVMYRDLPEKTAEQMVNDRTLYQFTELSRRFPNAFRDAFGEPTMENCADALRLGRQVYVGEGCWHCHSQFVRPVSNESKRYGEVSKSWEYQNELQRPVMFGTRRVGPDLSREGGRRSSDWHAVHFFRPNIVSPNSVMPEYPWLFKKDPATPTKRGLALITYIQWLGSWLKSYPYYEELDSLAAEEAY